MPEATPSGITKVHLVDEFGNTVSIGGGGGGGSDVQYAEDSAAVGGEDVTLAGAVRQDTLASSTSTDGDIANLKVNAAGALYVTGGSGGGAATVADGADVAQGTTTDLSSANTVVGILKAIKAAITGTLAVSGTFWQATQPVSGPVTDTQIRATPLPVSGTVGVTGVATAANQTTDQGLTGALTETAPATDTASSGLNGRAQRIAQRLTSLIGLLPTSLGQKTMANGLAVTIASDQSAIPVSGTIAVSGTMPVSNAGTFAVQVSQPSASTAAPASFTATSSTTILSANASAKLRTFANDSDKDLYLILRAAAASIAGGGYHVKVPASGGFFSTDYAGEIRGLMSAAIGSGQVNVGEFT